MDVLALGRALAVNRIAIGLAYVVAPGRAGRGWIGDAAEDGAAKVFTRALGARDLALGAGALRALSGDGAGARPWLAGQALADGTDLVATLLARDHLPRGGFLFAVAMAGASTAVAAAAALAADPAGA